MTTPDFGERDRKRKILVPFFTPFISPLIPALLKRAGYEAENLPMSTQASVESGLRYANNEICYPATLIVGDIVNALQSGRHDPTETAVAITQTGGQCRASNYIALIRKGLVNAGFRRRAGYIRIAGQRSANDPAGVPYSVAARVSRCHRSRSVHRLPGAPLLRYGRARNRARRSGLAARLVSEDAKMILESESESNILDAFAEKRWLRR